MEKRAEGLDWNPLDYHEYELGSLGQYREHKLATCFRGDEYGISSLAFDPQEDLLWAATYGVSVKNSYIKSILG